MTSATPPSTCAVCRTARAPEDTVCQGCGLVFSTQEQGATLDPTSTIACLDCGRLLPADALSCDGCGADVSRIAAALRFGQTLAGGRYTIQRTLTTGGMGAIYLATDHSAFDRTVVIKAQLPGDAPVTPEARERFSQEGRTLATLKHPNIPQIFAFFEERGRHYLVMEYVEGADLEQGLSRIDSQTGLAVGGAPYPREEVLRWGIELCRMLEYLAARQPHPVVHRDIKPANIILDRHSGDLFLVDFGTAALRLQAADGGASSGKSAAYGTPGYAPPEQYKGHSEPRSDVYALAATLYHLASDDDPRAHPFSFPQLDELEDLGQQLRLALDPDPARRPDAATFREQLDHLLRNPRQPIPAPDGTPLRTVAALVAWCEQHWEQARDCIGAIPSALRTNWHEHALAHTLAERIASCHQTIGNADHVLDSALALLDPQGFGAAQQQIAVDRPEIDTRAMVGERFYPSFIVSNTGRRHAFVVLRRDGPWFEATPTEFWLPPGRHQQVTMTVDLHALHSYVRSSSSPPAGGTLSLVAAGQRQAEVRLTNLKLPENLPKRAEPLQVFPPNALAIALPAFLLVLMLIFWLITR
ncbi:MAG TPA: protein kinase [Roseiflexaceae bacterium]|nr:protein kinase [Roseiflexaceae bacterium]